MADPRYSLLPCNPAQLAAMPQFADHPLAASPVKPTLNRTGISLVPAGLNRASIDLVPDVDLNTIAPDCTAVQVANCIKAFSTLYSGVSYSVPQQTVLTLFATVVGCAPTFAAICQTQGAVYADIISEVRKSGILVSDQLLAVPDISVLDNSPAQLALATDLFACAGIGIRVYALDEQNIAAGVVLDANGADPGAMVGRHMTMTWDYTNTTPSGLWRVNFWGKWVLVTTRWLQARVDESWVHNWRNLVSPDNVALFPQLVAESQLTWQ